METFKEIKKPLKDEQKLALKSYALLASAIEHLEYENPEIEIVETHKKIKIPLKALKVLGGILQAMGEGQSFSIVPIATEVTTQKAAEILGCSRPHLVKLLENGEIEFTKVGKHRRIKFKDVTNYKKKMKQRQKQHLIEMMQSDEAMGLYDS